MKIETPKEVKLSSVRVKNVKTSKIILSLTIEFDPTKNKDITIHFENDCVNPQNSINLTSKKHSPNQKITPEMEQLMNDCFSKGIKIKTIRKMLKFKVTERTISRYKKTFITKNS